MGDHDFFALLFEDDAFSWFHDCGFFEGSFSTIEVVVSKIFWFSPLIREMIEWSKFTCAYFRWVAKNHQLVKITLIAQTSFHAFDPPRPIVRGKKALAS